ncbi:GroES-like protein [Lophiostoma macrostomum CBS 122681]|uniref:GroES-like protein n=1 Tax=Lophiostoma macrostomum CBS 122681 TaxID=1314788 RepID=A0A6A6SYC9_9PLEO|nr:GroES-like protein [Lophiostoma macrostomum CBS 122681]
MAKSAVQNRGLLLSSFKESLQIVDLPSPDASTGSVVVAVLATFVAPYAANVYNGTMQFNLPLPMTPGFSCVGRVHKTGADATSLKENDLVFVDPVVRGRDSADVTFLLGHFEGLHPAGRSLMENVWRNGTLQKFVAVPLENCFRLNENRLVKELSYTHAELATLLPYAVAAGPLLETANLQAGETIVIGPAGGTYSGAAVEIALALGANVVALGRSEEKLASLRKVLGDTERLQTVVMTGEPAKDVPTLQKLLPDGADVHNNWTPTGASEAIYLNTVGAVLKRNARVVLSGGTNTTEGLPNGLVVLKDISVTGKFMYNPKTVQGLIGFVSSGLLKIGERSGAVLRTFGLEQSLEALEVATKHGSWKDYIVVTPNDA